MDWQVFLAAFLIIPVVLFPAVFVWYMNAGGLYAVIRRRRTSFITPAVKVLRRAILISTPIIFYAFAIAFSASRFGWQVALAIGLVLPIVLLPPILVWGIVTGGLYSLVRDSLSRRASPEQPRFGEETVRE